MLAQKSVQSNDGAAKQYRKSVGVLGFSFNGRGMAVRAERAAAGAVILRDV